MADYRELGKKLSNWGRWGSDDKIGTLNFLTDRTIIDAGKLIKKGRLFDLSVPLGSSGPSIGGGGRVNPIHLMGITPADKSRLHGIVEPYDLIVADDWITMPLQCATQWDGLGHVGYDGCFYNHVSCDTVSTLGGSSVLSIEDIISKGPTGRGVLLDITAIRGRMLHANEEITPADLEAAEKRQNIRVGAGDILLLRTGWIQQFTVHRSAVNFWQGEPGIGLSCMEWLYKREVAAIAADNFGVEMMAPGLQTLACHCVLIRDMGMTLGEIFDLDELAADCEADGVWEFFFTSPPLKVEHGVGSPITPLAIK